MTLMQAFKVWWSYSWRASILVIPLWTIITVWAVLDAVSAVQNMQLSAQSLNNMSVGQLSGMLSGGVSMSILAMVLTSAIQVFAMRWTLNSSWSDFRLQAVPPDRQAGQAGQAGNASAPGKSPPPRQ